MKYLLIILLLLASLVIRKNCCLPEPVQQLSNRLTSSLGNAAFILQFSGPKALPFVMSSF